MKKESKQPQQPAKDDKEKEPVEQQQYETGKERPEQAPDVPPQERTVGIP